MPQHTIDIYAPKGGNILAGERYARIAMPTDSSQKEITIAAEAAKAAVSQVLGRLGVNPELRTVYVMNDDTEEEIAAVREGTANGTVPTHSIEEVMAHYDIPAPEQE